MRHFASRALSMDAPHRVGVLLAGAGGTGSQVLHGLARMDHALRTLGYPGLFVVVADPDRVSASNIGRQSFSPADRGQSKAAVLVTRINRFFGLDWESLPAAVGAKEPELGRMDWLRRGLLDVVIGCVDTARARRGISEALGKWLRHAEYWLDFGNSRNTGQVVLGTNGLVQPLAVSATQDEFRAKCEGREVGGQRLPTVLDLFPDMADDAAEPSCSMEEALARQDLYINATLADFGLSLLWRLIRQGVIEIHGLFLNLEQCLASPLRIDPEGWKRLGWEE